MELAGKMGALLAGGELAGLTAQVVFEPVPLADVARGAVGAHEPPVLEHPDAADLDEDVMPVGVAERQSRSIHLGRVPAQPPEQGLGLAAGIAGEDRPVGPAEHLGRGQAEHRLGGIAQEDERAGLVGHPHEVGRRLDEVAVAFLGRAQFALQALALADVARGPVDPGERAVRVLHADRVDLGRRPASVLAEEDELGRLARRRVGDQLLPAVRREGHRVGQDDHREMLADELVRWVAGHPLHGLGQEREAALRVGREDDVR